LDSVERSYDVLLDEVRAMRVRVEGRDITTGLVSPSASSSDKSKTHDEKVQELVRDIERLKWRLIEKDKDAAEKVLSSRRGGGGGLQKSRSLEEDSSSSGGSASGYLEQHHQFDLRMQLDTVRQEAQVSYAL
jgi:cell division septum initiation protein DivIVA